MSSFHPLAGMLHKHSKSRPLSAAERGSLSPDSPWLTLPPITLIPSLVASVVAPNTPAYEEARALQAARFARASMPGGGSYLETVDFAPDHTIPLVVRRAQSGELVAAARLELAGASIIEDIVQFPEDTDLARSIRRGTFAEVGGFATRFGLSWAEALDSIDTISGAFVQLALRLGYDYLLLFPRRTLMGLLLAQLPQVLPPYRFELVREVVGWQEASARLQAVRQLHVKGLPAAPGTLPVVYAITPASFAEDVQARLRTRDQRQQQPDLVLHLRGAMRQAQKQVDAALVELHTRSRFVSTPQLPLSPPAPDHPQRRQGYLPFPASIDFKAEYLQQVVAQGGAAVKQYKTMSYELLQLAPGMQVLDVGCGAGVDLLALAEQVGQTGQVVGLDNDRDVLQAARSAVAGHGNVLLVASEAAHLPFLDDLFDRVRADRVLQHVARPAQVLTEMWRVLRPGGLLVLTEPDWKAVALVPGSQHGGDDDTILEHVLKRYQRQLPHATIGRQLHSLLIQQGAKAWEHLQVQAVAFTLTAWPVVDTLLQLSASARALAQEQPALKKEIDAWLKAVEEAHLAGTFLASIPLFFVAAQKISGAAQDDRSPGEPARVQGDAKQ